MSTYTPIIHPWNHEIWQHLTSDHERSNHALLFLGGTGLGKRALSFSFAHHLLSSNHSQSESLFNAGSHPDLHILMPEVLIEDNLEGTYANRYIEAHSGKPKKDITINQIRLLTSKITTHPHISSHRMILIHSAESMNQNAANALLKNLEDPPQNTLFILVADEASALPKTIVSRCSIIAFRPGELDKSKEWLQTQNIIPENEIDNYLAMSINHPLMAIDYFQSDYIGTLKSVFTDVNNLWSRRSGAVQVAKNWHSVGGLQCVEILQKLTADLIRSSLSESPKVLFFPKQQPWVQSSSAKLSRTGLVSMIDELGEAKKLLSTTVDELLVLETVSNKFRQLTV